MSRFNRIKPFLLAVLILAGLFAEGHKAQAAGTETIVVAGGCFWCVEADFEAVPGVIDAVSGFAGGTVPNPTYKQVTRGGTGHLEAVQITYDPDVLPTGRLLGMFLRSIDPTDSGGQFCDRGESYATAIFVSDTAQKAAAEKAKANGEAALGQKIVTPIRNAAPFYPAEAYHQDYAKSSEIVLTRFGPLSKAKAYKRYRDACGRDQRVRALWGASAPFAGG